MTTDRRSPARRYRWHPVPLGWALVGAAVLVTGVALLGPATGWAAPLPWLLVGAAAGFATSGST